ncbi:MAG: suppressor of fused domain protein [Armatimonadetes bacterium]|nr:hypothetical protein [Armatimonadota bacterium]MBS1701149.1 suppressor of fused domain protein [Armatimonadota bacterium]MBS1725120.1 suppressor of fused domain protein [Armatimonadota bacterium]
MDELPDLLPEPDGDLVLIEEVANHCQRFFGPCVEVLHENISEFVHIDIYRFGPDPVSNLVTFVTTGMAEKPMNVPSQVQDPEKYRYAELVLQMPVELFAEFGQPASWPIATLVKLARMPHRHETWLWGGHTIGDDPAEPFPGTDLSVAVLWPPMILPQGFPVLDLSDGRRIVFLTLGFLNAEERAFSKEHYQQGLFEEIARRGRKPEEFLVLHPDRASLFA